MYNIYDGIDRKTSYGRHLILESRTASYFRRNHAGNGQLLFTVNRYCIPQTTNIYTSRTFLRNIIVRTRIRMHCILSEKIQKVTLLMIILIIEHDRSRIWRRKFWRNKFCSPFPNLRIWLICLGESRRWRYTLAKKPRKPGARVGKKYTFLEGGQGRVVLVTGQTCRCHTGFSFVSPSRRFMCICSSPVVCSTRKLTARYIKPSWQAFTRLQRCLVNAH